MFKRKSKISDPDNENKAYEYVIFLLSIKLRTVGEILEKMTERGYAPAVIERTMDLLKERHYLDDQRYAEIFLENLKAYRNFGYYAIKKKFIEKKLSLETIELVLANGLLLEDEEKIAQRWLAKEGFRTEQGKAVEQISYQTFNQEVGKKKQKLAQRLKSRGFRGEVIAKLLF